LSKSMQFMDFLWTEVHLCFFPIKHFSN